jgi:DNA/RNA-binding domain of Phe-tRNA-synthetase-like protein
MRELLLKIEPDVLDSFPGLRVGGFLVKRVEQASEKLSDSTEQMEAARADLIKQGIGMESISAEPRVAAWRDAFKRCGLKPATFRSSPEQLARRLLRGENICTPLPVVNTYCAVSAQHLTPMGAYDLDRLTEMQITLRFADLRSDHFDPLGGRQQDMPLSKNIVVYASGKEIICWSFNFRDSRRTSLEKNTRFAVFLSEAVSPVHYDWLGKALEQMLNLLVLAGAEAGEIQFADCKHLQATLTYE